MAGTASISGLISGLDTDSIISKMVSFAQQPITLLQDRQSGYTNQLAAWQAANTRMLALKLKANSLATPSSFRAKAVSVSDSTALSASVGPDAAPGSYTFAVNRLAQAQKQQSQGYADTGTTTVGTGTITVGVGTAAKAITIDGSNNTLAGLRDAINRSGAGVSATITDLGSLTAHDYHLVLTGGSTGADNTITWNPSLSGGTAPAMTTTAEATDASITIGSGAAATTVTKSTNNISDIFPGLSLNLKAADVSKTVTVTVSADTTQIKQQVQDFVDQYNGVMAFVNNQFTYDSASGTSGALFGDYTLQNVQSQLRSGVLSVVPGLAAGANTLSQIGFGSDTSDNLTLDTSKLEAALNSDPNAVMKLFAGDGETTDQGIAYVDNTNATKATGAGAPYQVRIDQTALQARITAGAAQTQNLAADETLTINGTAVALTAGMTPQQVLDKINSLSGTTGVKATHTAADGTGTGNYLTFQRSLWGSGGHVSVSSTVSNGGAAAAANTSGIGTTAVTETSVAGETGTGTGNAGRDVSGAFGVTVNGVTTWEDATGTGQNLTGNTGNGNTEGLSVRVTAASTGMHGQVTLTQGIGALLDKKLGFLTGPKGAVTTAEDSLNSQITDITKEVASQNDRLSAYEDEIRTQFQAMEQSIGSLQSQGTYLTAQFAAMNKSK